ncbi:DUF885 family protein [Marinicella sediminis]|uniref:DUF885 family protein n=1 Tax=Marinicella sediminis TaxID=1792834 RepID=A0ABV7JBK0_9GAMM|nr:DUF885 family protein [Marinicella sediminis]
MMIKKILVLACLLSLSSGAETNNKSNWHEVLDAVALAHLPTPQLDFAQLWNHGLGQPASNSQLTAIDHATQTLQKHSPANACQQVFHSAASLALQAHKLRLQLLSEPQSGVTYQGSVHQLPDGDQWYRYLTMWWLGEDLSADHLYAVGEQTFTKAITQYRQVSDESAIPPMAVIRSADERAILEHYQDTQELLMNHLKLMFIPTDQIAPLHTARSTMGADFPAPGYYNSAQHTMYYHPLTEDYELRQVDWLFLHEGIPGHHYQSQVAQHHSHCQLPNLSQGQMAFVEGWAAYAETLGRSLGLYRHPDSQRFALKWEALRAMRVMIDVGIHARGWSIEQAQMHWRSHFPEGTDVMNREIERIKRWPMQVNTYVYGKHRIEQLKQQLQNKADFNLRTFHQNILTISHLPISTLNHYQQLFTFQEQP